MDLRVQREKKGRRRWIVALLVLAALSWGANHFIVSAPVAAALAADPRTSGIGLTGHMQYYVNPVTLVLDLRPAPVADTTDLFRALMLAASALDQSAWPFHQFVLSRDGDAVYTIAGADLYQLAHDYGFARKPLVVLGTLLTKLRLPDGRSLAAGTVEGAARRWATGRP
jgi:hypothetical protein